MQIKSTIYQSIRNKNKAFTLEGEVHSSKCINLKKLELKINNLMMYIEIKAEINEVDTKKLQRESVK